jgi:hypothetical protein
MKKMLKKRTDKQRLDELQALLGRYTGKLICRWSGTGRGWRLHEDDSPNAVKDIRKAIDEFLDNENKTNTFFKEAHV